ncbi:S26 family signal peptidase [Ottowia sp.]|uniref:S26 family signal peptidase n=1 Tax=Ottowia sp. TaxID=1898956 RepID=UPI0025EEC9EC|nr:S26 family signal peptidase [Ottowia sp.]
MAAAITIEKIQSYKPIVLTWWSRWWPAAIAFVVGFFTLSHYVTFAINASDSLPQKVFLVLKTEKYVGRGDFAAFPWEGNRPYPAGLTFIKQVGGVAGDVVSVDEKREFFVSTKPSARSNIPGSTEPKEGQTKSMGIAKTHGTVGNMRGVPLELGFVGTIPDGHFFMHAWNKDSLDSRYQLLGLVPKEKIIGRAIPLF